ncbi:metal ABC transporter solute-binding protein, Zn/Mn family [Alloalcanivorax gelatiniphagus]|uniref:High-affinity zinc uptake system protein ZnuA n=1 Tax=Alloalcanivorax gelatiniphagus TaxID=1194167 RepID=A0ABY2XJH3_9GAMM|nr:zinc ABC transporter substrate-binding protein [Alloalcanivorax gelatiniphagus]TMW11424.1 zinc ABC transporter substrate-binding protein [Alloalcanivorax gelatiniphagus]
MRPILFALLLVSSVLLSSPATARVVVASVEPVAMALRALYGDRAEVVTLLAPNQSPHNPMLSPRQMLTLRQADLVVWLGAEAEPAVADLMARRDGPSVAMLSLPDVTRRQGGHHHDHDHDQGAHDHDGHSHDGNNHDGHDHTGALDPHLWLDPDNIATLARGLAERDGAGLPAGQPADFLAALEEAREAARQRLAPVAGRAWISYHNPWAYFQHPMGLSEPVTVSAQLGAGPGSRRFVALAGQIRDRQVGCAILEPEAQRPMIKRLCPDCRMVALDPLGRDHPDLDYPAWLDQVVAAGFERCLGR